VADTPKHFVGFPEGREMTEDEAYQFGLMLFDAINAERDAQKNSDTNGDTDTDTASQ
jgi:hypothetical protein